MNDLQALFVRGMKSFGLSKLDTLTEIANGIVSGKYTVFIAEKAAFVIISMPNDRFGLPQVIHFHAEKPALRRKLVVKTLDFIKEKGYNKLIAINGSGAADKVWQRAFRREGWEIKAVNTVFEFGEVK